MKYKIFISDNIDAITLYNNETDNEMHLHSAGIRNDNNKFQKNIFNLKMARIIKSKICQPPYANVWKNPTITIIHSDEI